MDAAITGSGGGAGAASNAGRTNRDGSGVAPAVTSGSGSAGSLQIVYQNQASGESSGSCGTTINIGGGDDTPTTPNFQTRSANFSSAGMGVIPDWPVYQNVVSTTTYTGMAMSTTTTTSTDTEVEYDVGDWIATSCTLTSTTRSHTSTISILLNGIQVATAQAGPTGTGGVQTPFTTTSLVSGTGGPTGGYITQAMIDARTGTTRSDDVWTYDLDDSGGASSATGSMQLWRDSLL